MLDNEIQDRVQEVVSWRWMPGWMRYGGDAEDDEQRFSHACRSLTTEVSKGFRKIAEI